MENAQSPETNNESAAPKPEVLKPRTDDVAAATPETPDSQKPADGGKKPKRHTYRPSHKATFISLGVVIAILAINAAVLAFVLKRQAKINDQSNDQVTISQDVLDKLGVNRSSVGEAGIGLTIGPNTQFKNNVTIAGDTSMSGQLQVNGRFTANDANLTQLKAGDTSLAKLNINGDLTTSNANLRKNLFVQGSTRLQGAVTITNLLTVYSNLNVSGNLTIGGTFSSRALSSISTLTVGGHIVTSGSSPTVSGGSALGNNGTVSISGTDAAGTVSVGVGTGSVAGTIANINFHTDYSTTPNIVITPVGRSGSFYITRNASGFTIHTSSALSIGGFAIDYIAVQ